MKMRLFALFLAFCVAFTAIPTDVFASETQDAKREEHSSVTEVKETSAITDITRIQWLQSLTEVYGMSVEADNYPDNYYSDIDANYAYYYDVMLATEFGLVDVEAGDAFHPDEPATREFAAHTLNACMGYVLEEKEYTFAEAGSVTYPDDIQIAINQGWFGLPSNKEFSPNAPVNTTEQTILLGFARADVIENQIDENHNNTYTLKSDVIVIPDSVEVEMTAENTYLLSGQIPNLQVGNKIAFLMDEFPVVKKISDISITNGKMTLYTEHVETEEAFSSIDCEGVMNGNLLDIQVYSDDIELSYFVGGTAENEYEDGKEYDSPDGLKEEEVSAVKLVKSYEITKQVAEQFDLGKNAKAQITCTISNPKVDYRINTNTPYINFDSTVTFSCNVSMDVLEAINVPNTITLANIPIGYVGGYIKATLNLSASGDATMTLVENVSMGVKWSDTKNKLQVTKNFQKEAFTLQARVDASVGVRLTAGFDIVLLDGNVYGEVGAKAYADAVSYGDGKLPNSCLHLSAYMYAKMGYKVNVDLLAYNKSFSDTYTIYDEKNSPIKLAFHYEDGKTVYACTRNGNNNGSGSVNNPYKYYTPANSKYGYTGGSSGVSSSGENYTIFEYEVEGNNARITKYNGNYASISIPSNLDGYRVVEIGAEVFRNHDELRMVVIPDSVTVIGHSAFENCDNLSSVILPEGLTSIENDTFWNCDNLTSVILPDSLTSIESSAFYDCDALTGMAFPENLTNIGSHAFSSCDTLLEITLPKNLVKLGYSCFEQCEALTKVYITKKLCNDGQILAGGGPFAGCKRLNTIEFESGVSKIPSHLLDSCLGITQMVIPNTVSTIGYSAFWNCDNLTTVILPDSLTSIESSAFYDCDTLTGIVFTENLTSIGSHAFYSCDTLQEITLPKNLVELGYSCFAQCEELTKVYIPKKLCNDGQIYAGGGPFVGCKKLNTIEFESGVSKIPSYLLDSCLGITQMVIPNTVSTIGYSAFENCDNLTTVILPDSLTSIESSAFYDCDALIEITIPKKVNEIGDNVFSYSNSLHKVTWDSDYAEVPNSTFNNCTSLQELYGFQTITRINDAAFSNTKLNSISIFNKVESIGDYAFYNNDALTKIDLPNTTTDIGYYAFYDSDALTTVSIPDSVTDMGQITFADCDELSSVTLGKGLTSISRQTFMDCPKLVDIEVPYNVTEIKEEAFKNDTALASVILPQKTTAIADNAFSYPDRMTIYGVKGSFAQSFAAAKGMRFVERSIPATAVSFSSNAYTLKRHEELQLMPVITPANFTDLIVFKSSDTNVAKVSENGKVTATGIGTATITVTVGNVSASCVITIVQPVTSVGLSHSSVTLDEGKSCQLSAYVYPSNATNKNVTWTSSDTSVATISADGLLTAMKTGTCTITVKSKDENGYSATCKVTVNQLTKYHIAFNGNGATSGNMSTINNCKYGTGYTLTANAFVRKGYVFNGWNTKADGTGTSYVNQASVKNLTSVNGQTVTLYAQWKVVDYAITYNLNGGTNNTKNPSKYNVTTAKITLQNPTRNGFTFGGWYSDAQFKNKVTEIPTGCTGNITLYAKWDIFIQSIEKAEIKLSKTSYNYDGKTKSPVVTVTLNGIVLTKDKDYKVSYAKNKNIGTATVTISGINNYNGKVTKKFTIKAKKGATFTASKCKYEVTGTSTVKFKGITSSSLKKVTIPKTVKYGGKSFKVTEIGKNALKKKTKLTTVVIGANVKTIGVSAFEGCKKLNKVTIGSAVTTIDDKAFKNCTALKSISIPTKVTKIDTQAFYGCKKLKTITIKSTKLKTVGKNAFKGIDSKAKIKVPKSKLKSYKKLLKNKGQGSKVTITK